MAGERGHWSDRILTSGLAVYDVFRPAVHRLEDLTWAWRGKPYPPPPPVKQRTVRSYGERFGLDTLVETGTFLGDMAAAVSESFTRIISIELNEELFARAKRRFAHYPHVSVFQGNSAEVLPKVLADLDEPALFWLDAHYSGNITARGPLDTPIVSELDAILSHRVTEHVILIDDARVFNGQHDYPELSALHDFLMTKRPDWHWEVEDDIIRFHSRKSR